MKKFLLAAACGALMLTGCSSSGESKNAQGTPVASESVTPTTDQTFVRDVLKSKEPVLVDFYADWCGPCKALSPTVEEVAAQYAGKVKFMKVNIDENTKISNALGLDAVPVLMTFKNGKAVDTSVGLVSKEAVVDLVQKSL
ncbi:MAG TPA: thioredoxin [Drouetiella sp.]